MHGQQFGRMALLCASLIWGSSFFVMKNAVDGIPVFLLLAIRFTMGLALLAAVFCKRLKKNDRACCRAWDHGGNFALRRI